jgi:signal transduction histidine kinase
MRSTVRISAKRIVVAGTTRCGINHVASHNHPRGQLWHHCRVIATGAGVHRHAVVRWMVVGLAGMVTVISLVFARGLTDPPTTYAASSRLNGIAAASAGVGLVAAGAWFAMRRPYDWTGTLAMLAGSVWMVTDWIGWWHGPAILLSVAMVVQPFLLALIVSLAISFASSGPRRAPRQLVIGAYVVTVIVSLGQATLRDPLFDRYCWDNCTTNVFLVHADLDIMRFLRVFAPWSTISIGALAAVAIAHRLATDTLVARHAEMLVLVPAFLAVIAEASHAAVLLWDPTEDPQRTLFAAVYLARAATLIALAAGLAVTLLVSQRTRTALTRLARRLDGATQPGSLQATLAATLGDRELQVGYWLPEAQQYVDAEGRHVQLTPNPAQTTTALVRNRLPIALIVHDRGLRDSDQLPGQIGAATRLAVDNERLRAASLAHIRDLQASRARLIEAGDTSRQHLERDLHDGAQQRLLAVAHELRLAAATNDNRTGTTLLDSAIDQAQQALAELRDIAHGIFPAILADAGLGPALSTLADRAAIAVEVTRTLERRYPPAAEIAAYSLVAAVIERAAERKATYVAIDIGDDNQRLIVGIVDDGVSPIGPGSTDARDRIGALGGQIDLVDGRLRAEIPCASL